MDKKLEEEMRQTVRAYLGFGRLIQHYQRESGKQITPDEVVLESVRDVLEEKYGTRDFLITKEDEPEKY